MEQNIEINFFLYHI